MDLAIAEAIVGSFWEDLRNSGARKQGAAGARPVGGAGVPLPAALGQGSPTLQSVRLLALLLQLRVLWSKAAIAALQAVQLLSLLLQHKRREGFHQGAAIWLLILLLRHKRRKLLQHGVATRQLFLLLRHKLGWPWPAYTGLLQEYHSFPSRWWWLVFTGQVATGEKTAAWCLLRCSSGGVHGGLAVLAKETQ